MNNKEKAAFRESVIVVMVGLIINFPIQTFLLWLTIDSWSWTNTLAISIFTQAILTVVALVRVYSIRMRFLRGKF
jgi:membrane protein YdbS with pleckstrin-like domain